MMNAETIRRVTLAALRDYEYKLDAHYDGHPNAIEERDIARAAIAAIEAGGAWEPVTELKLRDGHVLRMSSEAMAISYDHEALTDIYWPDDGYEYAVVRRRTTLRKRPDSEATP